MSSIVGNVNNIFSKFEWVIDNFCISCKVVGKCLESPDFTTNTVNSNIQWFMQLYPKGKTEDFTNYMSIFLYATAEIKAVCTFSIVNNEGAVMVSSTMDEHVFGTPDKSGWGKIKFASRDFVTNPANAILNNDKLTIVCEIRCKDSEIKSSKATNSENEDDYVSSRLESKYEALLTNSKFSDVSLISEGKTVKAHKCILASTSKVFDVMFDADMKEKQDNTVEIADIKYDVLVEMIRFVYAGKVNNIDSLVDELAVAAEKYALDELKDTCEKTMIKNLNSDNVVDCLQLADRLRMAKLKERAIEFIVDKASDVTDKSEFDLLPNDIVRQICRQFAKRKSS